MLEEGKLRFCSMVTLKYASGALFALTADWSCKSGAVTDNHILCFIHPDKPCSGLPVVPKRIRTDQQDKLSVGSNQHIVKEITGR